MQEWKQETYETLTEGDTEGPARSDRAVLELVVHEAERDDQSVEKKEDEKEHAPSTLVDHPVVVLLHRRAGDIGRDGLGGGGVGALEPLEAAALGLVLYALCVWWYLWRRSGLRLGNRSGQT